VLHAKRFQLVNWVPAKLGTTPTSLIPAWVFTNVDDSDIPVILPHGDLLEFGEKHLGHGLQAFEEELPNDMPGLSTYDPVDYLVLILLGSLLFQLPLLFLNSTTLQWHS
jgi:ubiquitin carboxyl-terminal hydrolase 5/13